MGQTLSEPVTSKDSIYGENEYYAYGASGMQGWRISMEDAHATVLSLPPASETSREPLSFFAVFDGHGGDRVAKYCGAHMARILSQEPDYAKGAYVKALDRAFIHADDAILADRAMQDEPSGCTATAVLLAPQGERVFCANAGDSRTVIGIRGRAKPLSYDHKPQNEAEKSRICMAGGFVDFGRVNGNLALSRAIGDFEFKKSADLPPEKQIVTAQPDVMEHIITEDDEFIVLACDGIWDCKTSQEVVEFVRRGIAARMPLESVAENLMDNCISATAEMGGIGCDNMTVVIVALLQGKTKAEWYDLVAARVENGDGPVAPPSYAEMLGPGYHHGEENSQVIISTEDDEEEVEDEEEGETGPEERDLAGGVEGDEYDMGAAPAPGLTQAADGRKAGRVITLPDGTEILADAGEMISVGTSMQQVIDDQEAGRDGKKGEPDESDISEQKL